MNKKIITPESMPAIVAGVRDSDYRTLNAEEMSQAVGAVALPTGVWDGIAGGLRFVLNIASVDTNTSTVTGQVVASHAAYDMSGHYDDATNHFTFQWGFPNLLVTHDGYYFIADGAIVPNHMAGIYTPPGGGASGWYATLSPPVIH